MVESDTKGWLQCAQIMGVPGACSWLDVVLCADAFLRAGIPPTGETGRYRLSGWEEFFIK